MNLAEIEFDKDDQSLFQIDDLSLKADAIRHSILPRLNILLNHAILQIKTVYDVEVLVDSHITQSPNFRIKRNNNLEVDYKWAAAGMSGKWQKEKWLGFNRQDDKPVQILPFKYGIVLLERGLSFKIICDFMKGLSAASYAKLIRFHIDFEKEIHPLCYLAEAKPQLNWEQGCEPCAPFAEHYQWMIKNGISEGFKFFESKMIGYPVTPDTISDLIDQFVILYPVYDSYLQIAKGEKIRLELLSEKLNAWLKQKSKSEHSEEAQGYSGITDQNSEMDLQKIKELAGLRIKVMPAIRWQVFQRDLWKCVACGRSASDEVILHVDHIMPRSKGGSDTIDNYQTLCNVCNIGKSNKDNTDLRR